jgi:hypothetical protein
MDMINKCSSLLQMPSLPSFEVLPRHGYNCLDFETCFEFEILVGAEQFLDLSLGD